MSTLSKQELLKAIEKDLKDLNKMYSERQKLNKSLEEYFIQNMNVVIDSSNLEVDINSGKINVSTLKEIGKKIDVENNLVVKKILSDNKVFMTKFKKQADELGYVAKDLMVKVINDVSVGSDRVSKDYWINRLSKLEVDYSIKEKHIFSAKDIANLQKTTKLLISSPLSLTEEQYIDTVARAENFIDRFINAKEKVDGLLSLKKADKKWLDENPREEAIVNKLIFNFDNKMMSKTLESVNAVKEKDLVGVKSELLPGADPVHLVRAKRALIGVKSCLNYFLGELSNRDNDYDLTLMFLKDARDHLVLSKSCYQNNAQAMMNNSRMDTASRELIDDKLWEYLRSDEIEDLLKEQKKNSRKMR